MLTRGGYAWLLFLVYAFWLAVIIIRPGLTYATGFNSGFGEGEGWKLAAHLVLRMALQATVVVTGLCIVKIFPDRRTFCTKYGSRTLYVYLLHGSVVLPFAFAVFPPFGEAGWITKITMVVVPTLCCIPLFSEAVYKGMKKIFSKVFQV